MPAAPTGADTQGEPSDWAAQPIWHELETGFGAGLNFLRRWRAWRADAHRPGRLFYTAIDPEPVTVAELLQAAAREPKLAALARELAPRWQALLPGVHRFAFERERVLLTLCVGQTRDWLPTLDAAVDQVWLDQPASAVDSHASPAAPGNIDSIDSIDSGPEATGQERDQARMLARLCLPGSRLHAGSASPALQAELIAAGFETFKPSPAANGGLQARYAPRWQPRSALRPRATAAGRHAVVVGGGLSGSAVAWSLAQRGWTVELLDQAEEPAAGASALPAGLVAPHVSPDDGALSRLTRAGMRLTRQRAAELLREGEDWAASGVLEHQVEGKHSLPRTEIWQQAGLTSSRAASAQQLAEAGLAPGTAALWHGLASWLRPACLVRAQLDHPAIRWRGGCRVASAEALAEGGWRLLGEDGLELARAEQVVIAAAHDSRALLQASGLATPPFNPLRGQISWGALADLPVEARALLPAAPVNGHGCFM
ncbi:MAG: FAD-dependent 5-carboxymethylaminomethyl-2-thiouridine(34) oxidoreductase MnmC, partial [Pseudomonadota bacterium]